MSDSKKRKKSYYCHAKRQCGGRQTLDVGLKGFLITCNRREKETTREAYNLLNEYSSQLYEEEAASKDDHGGDIDFDEAIQGQIAALRGGGQKPGERRFQAVETNTSNCIFVKTTLDRPDELVTRLLTDVAATGRTKSRFVLKLFPVLGTCRADEGKIEQLVEELLRSYFADLSLVTYAIVYKVRCNNLSRETILPAVGRAVHRACPAAKVDLANPDYVVSVDVLNKFACVSVLKDFYKLRKYNLQELAKPVANSTGGTQSVENRPAEEIVPESTDDSKLQGGTLEHVTEVPQRSASGLTSESVTTASLQSAGDLTSAKVAESMLDNLPSAVD